MPMALTIQEAEIFVAKNQRIERGLLTRALFLFANFTISIMTKYFKGGIRDDYISNFIITWIGVNHIHNY